MAAKTPGSVGARGRPLGVSGIAGIAAGMRGIRANMRMFAPSGPRACRRDPEDLFATRGCRCRRDTGAPAAARNDVSRVALVGAQKTCLASYFGDRPRLIARPAATRGNRPAPPPVQPRRDA